MAISYLSPKVLQDEIMPFIPRELYYPTCLHVSHLILLPQENSPRGYRPGTHILLSPKQRQTQSKGRAPGFSHHNAKREGCPVSFRHHCNLGSKWFSSLILFILCISQFSPPKLKHLIFSSYKKSEKVD